MQNKFFNESFKLPRLSEVETKALHGKGSSSSIWLSSVIISDSYLSSDFSFPSSDGGGGSDSGGGGGGGGNGGGNSEPPQTDPCWGTQMASFTPDAQQQAPANYLDFYSQYLNQDPATYMSERGSDMGVGFGPNMRYIADPLSSIGAVIDIRHFYYIGQASWAGDGLEFLQDVLGQESGNNPQDFYSNELGEKFWDIYGAALENTPEYFSSWLVSFLSSRSERGDTVDNYSGAENWEPSDHHDCQ